MAVVTSAHATWFTDHRPAFDLAAAARPVTVAAVVTAVAVALAWGRLARRAPVPELRALQPFGRLAAAVPRLLAAHVGVALLALAARGAYLAPSSSLPPTWWGYLLLVLEGVVGCWLLVGIAVRPAALSLIVAGSLGVAAFGLLPVLERADLLGVALFLALLPPDDRQPAGLVRRLDRDRLRSALFALRTCAGTALIVVAVTEKLARPGLSLHFLHEYPAFNVARAAGLPVSDEVFLQAAGGIEILLGLLLILGVTPQLVALTAAAPFTLTLPFLGTDELLGHLPLYGILLTLLVYGSRVDTAPSCAWWPHRGTGRHVPAPQHRPAPETVESGV
jgi:uncharacterized membrane protein YphA (DoxX/SURF4 family)